MTWHANISRPSDRVILHLMDLAAQGKHHPKLTSPEEVTAFLASHPEIEAVHIYDSRFPRYPVPIGKFGPEMIEKLFPRPRKPV